jgi:hypothetical protein
MATAGGYKKTEAPPREPRVGTSVSVEDACRRTGTGRHGTEPYAESMLMKGELRETLAETEEG